MKELIERYLKNLMNAEEKSAFIGQLQQDEALQQEVRMVKMSIMLEAVLNAELQDEENANRLYGPIPNEKDNGNAKYNDFFPFWLLGIAASFLLVIAYFFGISGEMEQAYSTEIKREKTGSLILDLAQNLTGINHLTLTIDTFGNKAIGWIGKNTNDARSSRGIKIIDSLLFIKEPNGGVWRGGSTSDTLPQVNFSFSLNYCMSESTCFSNKSSEVYRYRWDFGIENDSVDWVLLPKSSYNVTIGSNSGAYSIEILTTAVDSTIFFEENLRGIKNIREGILNSIKLTLDSLNRSESINLSTTRFHKRLSCPGFFFPKKRVKQYEINQAKKMNQLYLGSLHTMKLHQYKSAEKQLVQLLKLQKTEKVRSLGWTEEDLQWRILLVKLAKGKLDRSYFLNILNDEQHKYHTDAEDLFQKLSTHLTWKGKARWYLYHQN